MFYDLHIHSCLSPCADAEMTINNILNMCMLKELDLISVTDHNSMKQYHYLKEAAKSYSFQLLYGVEVQTAENVHVCCYFRDEEAIAGFQRLLDERHPKLLLQKEFYGNQMLLDHRDMIIGEEEYLLVVSLNISLEELAMQVHQRHGAMVLAHAYGRRYGIYYELGKIPHSLPFDGIEVRNDEDKNMLQTIYPWLTDTVWLVNSDAHRLREISDRKHEMSEEMFGRLWRNAE